MDKDSSRRSVRASQPEGRGYINPRGYAPGSGSDSLDAGHPLHRYYRRRMRWVRLRWLTTGMIIGVLAGFLVTLGFSALAITQIPQFNQTFDGEPDVSVAIGESYLNREATNRLGAGYSTGVSGLTLKSVQIDLKPENRMDLQPVFHVAASFGFLNLDFDANAAVVNRLTVKDGKLVVSMIGDPQIGNLDVPLDYLPFDLKGEIARTIDQVNNEVLISEINKSLEAGFGGTDFVIEGVETNESGLVVRLKQK